MAERSLGGMRRSVVWRGATSGVEVPLGRTGWTDCLFVMELSGAGRKDLQTL